MNPSPGISLLDDGSEGEQQKALASRLGIPLIYNVDGTEGLLLRCNGNAQLAIGFASELAAHKSDILQSSAWFRPGFAPRHVARGRDPLMRAVGYKTDSLLDCTAGWGVDAAHFAHHNISVTALEQHPVVFALLESALADCDDPHMVENLDLVLTDSYTFLHSLTDDPEVIYMDPMYPPRPGSAAPRRPLRILQTLSELDNQARQHSEQQLLALARQRANRRVVVKRPHYASPLDNGASGSISAKLVRFDIYPPSS